MRFSVDTIGNALAWIGVCAMMAAAIAIAHRLGFAGLILLGLLTGFICTMTELNQDTPTWSSHVFRARMARPVSREQRMAAHLEREGVISPLRFYKWCGFFVMAVGILGFAWQQWLGG